MNVQPTKSVLPDGSQVWRLPTGELHRDDGPAITRPDGYEAWWQHGERHGVNGPAVTSPDGYEVWYQNGKLHRDDGPAITYSDGYEAWYRHGKLHRVGGPAVTYNGTEEWWINGTQVTEFEHAVVARAHALAEQGRTKPVPQS